jgi:hypothetical protein
MIHIDDADIDRAKRNLARKFLNYDSDYQEIRRLLDELQGFRDRQAEQARNAERYVFNNIKSKDYDADQ